MRGRMRGYMKKVSDISVLKLVLSALFLALGIVLPFLTGQLRQMGNMLLPMHLPVLVCGFVCGWPYGMAVGAVTPLLRSVLFGQPPLMPTAAAMAFELAAYGAVTGLLYARLPKKNWSVYVSLISAMAAGRVVWGVVSVPLYSIADSKFSFEVFAAGALLNAIPGIILQLVMVPLIVMALRRAGVIKELQP